MDALESRIAEVMRVRREKEMQRVIDRAVMNARFAQMRRERKASGERPSAAYTNHSAAGAGGVGRAALSEFADGLRDPDAAGDDYMVHFASAASAGYTPSIEV